MQDSWSDLMRKRLRAAASNPPTAETLRPRAEQAARRAVQNATARGRAPRVQVRASRSRLTVQAQGPGAGEVLNTVRGELTRARRQIIEDVRAESKARLRGTG